MAYEPKEWACGDVVTADALNNIEQGIADAQLPSVTASDNGKVLGVDGGEYALVEGGGSNSVLTYGVDLGHAPIVMVYNGGFSNGYRVIPINDEIEIGDAITMTYHRSGAEANTSVLSDTVKSGESIMWVQNVIGAHTSFGYLVKVEDDTPSKMDLYFRIGESEGKKITDLGNVKTLFVATGGYAEGTSVSIMRGIAFEA